MNDNLLFEKPVNLGFLFVIAVAITIPSPSAWSIAAAVLVDKTAETWQTYQDYSATFVMTSQDRSFHSEETRMGKVWFYRNGDEPVARLEYYEAHKNGSENSVSLTHVGNLIEQYQIQADVLYEYDPKLNTVTKRFIKELDSIGEMIAMVALLRVDPQELRRLYDLNPVEEITLNGREVYHFSIDPKKPEETGLPRREIWLDKEGLLPRKLIAFYPDQEIRLEFYTQKVNSNLTPDDVRLRVPTNVRVVDLTTAGSSE